MRWTLFSLVILALFGQTRATEVSNPEIVLGYASAVRLGLLDELQPCSTAVCGLLRALDDAVSSDKIADLGRTIAFSHYTWRVEGMSQ